MKPQSDLRLGGNMLFLATLICGGFAVAALWPVLRNAAWDEILAAPAAEDSPPNVSRTLPAAEQKKLFEQRRAAQQAHLAQTRRRAEQQLMRKRMDRQQAAQRHAVSQTRPTSHGRTARVTPATQNHHTTRTIQRTASRGASRTATASQAHSDAQRNEVYVPVNVHPVTVNVDGSAMSGEVARLAEGINQVLTAQREALQAQRQSMPQPLSQPMLVQTIPQQVLHQVPAAASVSVEEKKRLESIDATLQELASAFETLRSETRSAVAGISQDVTHAQTSHAEVTTQLLAEYRLAIDQQRELLQRHEDDVTARIRLSSFSDSASQTTQVVQQKTVTLQEPVQELRKIVTTPKPVPEDVDQFEEFEVAETADEQPKEVFPVEEPVVKSVPEPVSQVETRLLPIPEETDLVGDREFVEDAVEHIAQLTEADSDADELEAWIEDSAVPVETTEPVPVEEVAESTDPWDLDNSFLETDEEEDFGAYVESAYQPGRSVTQAAAAAHAAERQRVRSVAYEQTYRFPMPSVEHSEQRVRQTTANDETCETCRPQPQRLSQPRPRAQAQHRRPEPRYQQLATAAPQMPVATGRPGVISELGQNIRQGAAQMANGLAGSKPRVGRPPQNPSTESRFMHRMKSAFRGVGASGTVQ